MRKRQKDIHGIELLCAGRRHTRRSDSARRGERRRGIVLLLVLGLLAMFGLIGVTFVLLAGHARRGAEAQAKVGRADNPPERVADDVIKQILRGTNSHESVIGPHSLLEDLYGEQASLRPFNDIDDDFDDATIRGNGFDDDYDGATDEWQEGYDEGDEANLTYGIFSDTLMFPNTSQLPGVDGQIFELRIDIPDPDPSHINMGLPIDTTVPITDTTPAHVGSVLTMLNGPAAGMSTRIVGCREVSGTIYAQLLAFDGISTTDLINQINAYVANTGPIEYIINGTPFAGTGFGYEAGLGTVTDPLLTENDPDNFPYALSPNPKAFVPNAGYDDPAGPGGANEDYDAPDYQNMMLACAVPPSPGGPPNLVIPIPSLHRPSLVNYWFQQLINGTSINWPPTPAGSPQATDEQFRIGILMHPYGEDNIIDVVTGPNDDPNTIHSGQPSPADIQRIIDLKRHIILRPLPEDHPEFTGSNDNFYPLWDGVQNPVPIDANFDGTLDASDPKETFFAQWDVDNDGDGVMDSIWVDVGLPVRTMRDGRQYKPLAAILCLDLDGRLNLNAHGCLAQVGTDSRLSIITDLPSSTQLTIVAGGTNTLTNAVTRGQNVGPAEVNLAALPALAATHPDVPLRTQYDVLLNGLPNTIDPTMPDVVSGKYRGDYLHPVLGWIHNPGRYVDPTLLAGYDYPPADPLAANKYFDMPGLYDASKTFDMTDNSGTMSYGTPLDLGGGDCVGLDLRGQPLYVANDTATGTGQFIGYNANIGLRADNPYELNLSDVGRGVTRTNAADTPFTPNELETVLRPYDVDTNMLPGRLTELAPGWPLVLGDALVDHRFEVTTESWSIPCPSIMLPPELRTGAPNEKANSISDLLEAAHVPLANMRELVGPEIMAGLKMDLNRPFGNGRDGNGIDDDNDGTIDEADEPDVNGVVDEPGEGAVEVFYQVDASGGLVAKQVLPLYPEGKMVDCYPDGAPDGVIDDNDFALLQADYTNNSSLDFVQDWMINKDDLDYVGLTSLARQLYARHLYVMMLALMNYDPADANAQDVARKVAQWAVNIVDFRDRDSIMTGFEFDADPFTDADGDGNPWDVNGDLLDNDSGINYPHVVWGCERPELLISETLAFHDRRTEDTDLDGFFNDLPPNKDEDFDQVVPPEGSLFVELYNPWTDKESLPGEFYVDQATGTAPTPPGVILDQQTPPSTGSHPVWRLAIPEKADIDSDPDDPKDPITHYERTVYFTDLTDPTIIKFKPNDSSVQFFPGPGAVISGAVEPGQYAVIGPADRTYIGARKGTGVRDNTTRRIELGTTSPVVVQHNRKENNNDFPGVDSVQQSPVTVIVNQPRRLSASEPPGGYGALPDPVDEPLDTIDPALMITGTTEAYRVIHLQRLANPLMPYHAVTNPYRTIDSMPISITAFNGEFDEDDPGANAGEVHFHSRQRGDSGSNGTNMNIWSVVDYANATNDTWDYEAKWKWKATGSIPTRVFQHRFDYYLKHTLGYLNDPFHFEPAKIEKPALDATLVTVGWAASSKLDMNGDGDFDDPEDDTANVPNEYYGSPRQQGTNRTFPWLTWLNRPFTSEMELMLAPKTRSSLLLNQHYHSLKPNDYDMGFSMPGGNDGYKNSDQPFGHLANWFYDKIPAIDPATNLPNQPNWKLHRLLEFVRVPSPFVGTDLQGDPGAFAAGTHDYHPPFNRISKRRDPGRVNLNTITSQNVLGGLVGDYVDPPALPAFWDSYVQSRRGYTVTGADKFAMDADYPTRFANPFRSYNGYYYVPDIQYVPPQPGHNRLQDTIKSEVGATMLRASSSGGGSDPLFKYTSGAEVNNTDRNPAFRYGLLDRLGSTATTHSNVYAVWVTVGYFEVTETKWIPSAAGSPVDDRGLTEDQFRRIYPDGYQLGQELGSDTGDITRHRAFYIIDRSIPVGFRRGEDLNVENTILLRRFIE